LTHPTGERCRIDFLEAGRVHDSKFEAKQMPLAFAAVAGHSRPIVDQRDALADEAIEQGGFSDIRSANDGYGR
jgi:hypothetical protein